MDLTTAIKCVRPSVVQVRFQAFGVQCKDDVRQRINLDEPIGTGFVVSLEGYIITANHVIADGFRALERFESEIKSLSIGFAYPNTQNMRANFTLMDFDLIEADEVHDIALLKLKSKQIPPMFGSVSPLELTPVILNSNRVEDGVTVGISGYPLAKMVLVTNGGFLATSWAFEIKELNLPETLGFLGKLDIADYYWADININPGNSGGPVYLASDGSVIGVCVAYLPTRVTDDKGNDVDYYYNSGIAVVVPNRYVCDLLEKHAVSS